MLFDTNRTWDEDNIWEMLERSIIAAYGDAKRFIDSLLPGDFVFYSHRWTGLVAAAKVRPGKVKAPDEDTRYRDVELLTAVPRRGGDLPAMPFAKVSEITGKTFYWARADKRLYQNQVESELLLAELRSYLEPGE